MFHHCTVEGSRLLSGYFYWLNVLAIMEKQGLGPGSAGRISGSVNFYMSSTSSWLFSDDFLDISLLASRGAACPTSRAAACHLDSPSVDPHVHFEHFSRLWGPRVHIDGGRRLYRGQRLVAIKAHCMMGGSGGAGSAHHQLQVRLVGLVA